MRSLGAFVLLAGVGVGLFVYLPPPVDRDISLENAQRLWAQANRSSIPSAIPATSGSFSPHAALANLTPPKSRRAEQQSASSTVNDVRTAVAVATPALRTTVTGWQPIVSITDGAIKSGSGAPPFKPKDPTSRYKLVVEIQRKLKKRGCYWGRIDGSWGSGSKYAMQAFIDRINAALPVEEPDYVLLTLLQTNSNKTCDGCRARQTLTIGGSCVPQAIVANAQHKSVSNGGGGTEVFSWQSAGAPQPAAQPLMRPVGTTIVTTAPLPGHMAIGGPKQLPPPSIEGDNERRSVAAVSIENSDRTGLSRRTIRRAPAARGPARATRRKAELSRRRSRGVRAARRRNLMLSLGGAY